MAGMVFFDASCLLDTWSMAKCFATAAGVPDATMAWLDVELRRGTCPAAVRQSLWTMLDRSGVPPQVDDVETTNCIDRTDALGQTCHALLRHHLLQAVRVVVLSDLPAWFDHELAIRLHAHHVLSAQAAGDVLVGAAARRAVEEFALSLSVRPSDCVGYGRPSDTGLLQAVGRPNTVDYAGLIHGSDAPVGFPVADRVPRLRAADDAGAPASLNAPVASSDRRCRQRRPHPDQCGADDREFRTRLALARPHRLAVDEEWADVESGRAPVPQLMSGLDLEPEG